MPMLKTITAHNGCSNIFRYLEDGRALDKVYVGLETPERWDLEMDDTREIAGHDKPTKKGRPISYRHFILSADPLDKISREEMLAYAQEWAESNLAGGQYAIFTHDHNGIKHAHIILNATKLSTGRKWQFSNDDVKKLARSAQAIGKKYGLSQLPDIDKKEQAASRRRERNVGLEEKMQARGQVSWKAGIREALRESLKEAACLKDVKRAMNDRGYDLYQTSRGITYVTAQGYKCRDKNLGTDYQIANLNTALAALDYARKETDIRTLAGAREAWRKTDRGRVAQRKLNALTALKKENIATPEQGAERVRELKDAIKIGLERNAELAGIIEEMESIQGVLRDYTIGERHLKTFEKLDYTEKVAYSKINHEALQRGLKASDYFDKHEISPVQAKVDIAELPRLKQEQRLNSMAIDRMQKRVERASKAMKVFENKKPGKRTYGAVKTIEEPQSAPQRSYTQYQQQQQASDRSWER